MLGCTMGQIWKEMGQFVHGCRRKGRRLESRDTGGRQIELLLVQVHPNDQTNHASRLMPFLVNRFCLSVQSMSIAFPLGAVQAKNLDTKGLLCLVGSAASALLCSVLFSRDAR